MSALFTLLKNNQDGIKEMLSTLKFLKAMLATVMAGGPGSQAANLAAISVAVRGAMGGEDGLQSGFYHNLLG